MNRIIDLLQFLTESPVGMFSTITGFLAIGIWLIIRFTRKVTNLELSQKHLEEGQKEIVKKIDQLSADMHEGFRKVDAWFDKVGQQVDARFEKVDERFEKSEQKMNGSFEKSEQEMNGRFVKVDDRFEKMDKKFDRKIESLSEKLDRNTEELRKDIANLRTDVRILQHDRFSSNYTVLRMKKNRASNKRKVVPIY